MSVVEANTRFIIDAILTNKGWNLDPTSKNKNVYFESDILNVVEGDIYEKLKSSGKRPDYVLLDNNKKPIAVIEAKAGGKDLEKALDQGTNYAEILKAPLIFAMNNSYCQTRHLIKQKPLFINEQEVNELIRTKEAIKFITEKSNEIYTIDKEILLSRQELITIFKNINDSLRSEGLSAGIERLTEFSNILFLKLYTENDKETIWNNLKNTPNDFLIDMVNTSLDKIQKDYKTDIFRDIKIKKPDTIREMITRLDKLKLSSMDTDIKGDAFEYFLKSSTATSNDLGEYFTPRHIVKAIINLVNPKFGEKIYDPFCGTGGFLTEAFNHIKDNTIIETVEDKTKLTHETIFGREITNNARLAKMNMILHGDGHNGIEQTDSLDNPVIDKYNVIATNMPFSQKIVKEIYDPETKKTIKKTLYSHLYQNNLAKNNGDGVCMLHCFNALKDGGRMALIVPEGVLFKQELKNVRKFLMDNCQLQSVVSLPQGIFLPYAGVKTDILYFTNCKKQSTDKVWFFDVKNDGFTLDNHRKKIKDNDLKKIDYIDFKKQDFDELKDLGFIQVDYEDIKKNDYNLSVNRYKREEKVSSKWEMLKILDLFKTGRGRVISKDFINNNLGDYPVYSSQTTNNGILGYINTYDFDGEFITWTTDGANAGTVFYRNGKFNCTNVCGTLKLKDNIKNINLKFIAYILNSLTKPFVSIASGNPKLMNNVFEQIQIPLPPLEIQEKIVKEIEEYEKIINSAKIMVENWEPKFEIKEEWEKVELKDVCEIKSGGTPSREKKEYWENGNIKWLTSSVCKNLKLSNTQECELINELGLQNSAAKLLNENTTLIALVGATIGKTAFLNFKAATNQNIAGVYSKNQNILNPLYLFYISQSLYDKFINLGDGGFTMANLSFVKSLRIPLPPIDEQQEIVAKIEEEQKYINGCKKMIEIYEERVKKVIDGVVGWGKK